MQCVLFALFAKLFKLELFCARFFRFFLVIIDAFANCALQLYY